MKLADAILLAASQGWKLTGNGQMDSGRPWVELRRGEVEVLIVGGRWGKMRRVGTRPVGTLAWADPPVDGLEALLTKGEASR